MTAVSIAERIEELASIGFCEGEFLSEAERSDIADWAKRFEECQKTREELLAMGDKNLVETAYWAMAEYANGRL